MTIRAATLPPRERSVTTGQRRLDAVLARFRETGIVTGDCRVDGPGTGQAAWCYPHGWGGAIQDCELMRERFGPRGQGLGAYDCPHRGIAAWIVRRHEATA